MDSNKENDYKIESWFQFLEQNNILVKSVFKGKVCYHLNSPLQFVYSKKLIEKLRDGYHSTKERGGYIIFKYLPSENNLILNGIDVEWICNKSDTPNDSYTINTPEHIRIEKETYLNEEFPIRFHTHPMDVKDLSRQSKRRLEIIDTSDADKRISFQYPFQTPSRTVILPDVLVVWDINYLNSFFVGTYNGLISPIGFLNHRVKVTNEFKKELKNDFVKWVDDKSDLTKAALITGSIITLVGGIFYPHIAGSIMKEVEHQTPMLAIGTQRECVYFGFTNSIPFSDFTNSIPTVTHEIQSDNEKEYIAVLERIKQGNRK